LNRIGVVVALAREAQILVSEIERSACSSVAESPMSIRISGVGATNATRAAQQLVTDGATALVSWGVAGALRPELRAGQLLLPLHIVDETGNIRSVDKSWHVNALRTLGGGARLLIAPVAQTHVLLENAAAKAELGRTTGACAADMESFAIGTVAEKAGLRFLTIRAIVDSLDMKVPACIGRAVKSNGQTNSLALLGPCLRAPWLLTDLLRLGLAFRAAARALTPIASCFVRDQLGFDIPPTRTEA
jgi:adenosylhomocysteine nucleosidase